MGESSGTKKRVLALIGAVVALVASTGCSSDDGGDSAGGDTQDIVGGRATVEGAWPGIVSVRGKVGSCGGTLVAPSWVLTAAHCLNAKKADGEVFEVSAGGLSRAGTARSAVERATVHPGYDAKSKDNDIALLELKTPIQDVVPASIVTREQTAQVVIGRFATVVGWGLTKEKGKSSESLREVDVPIVASTRCNQSYGNDKITKNMLCAGGEKGKDACHGDSGGPLYMSLDGKPAQVGLVSFGAGCGRAGTPGVYTRIGNYLDWISQTTRGALDANGELTAAACAPRHVQFVVLKDDADAVREAHEKAGLTVEAGEMEGGIGLSFDVSGVVELKGIPEHAAVRVETGYRMAKLDVETTREEREEGGEGEGGEEGRELVTMKIDARCASEKTSP